MVGVQVDNHFVITGIGRETFPRFSGVTSNLGDNATEMYVTTISNTKFECTLLISIVFLTIFSSFLNYFGFVPEIFSSPTIFPCLELIKIK